MSGGEVHDDLLYLIYFWLATWIASALGDLTRVSPLLFYLVFGCVLGNLKLVHHTAFLTSFAELCITVVFFALGFEEGVDHFMDGIKKAWGIASIGAAVPFAVGFGCTMAFWPGIDVKVAVMCGLAVTATAVSLTMIALKAEGLATSKPAIGIMTSAVLDDIASLALVAITVPIATGDAEPTASGILWILGKAVIFFAIVAFAHKVVLPHDVQEGIVSKIPLVSKYGARNILKLKDGEQAMLMSLLFGLFFGMVAVWLGFHPAIGAYMGGLIIEQRYYDLDDRRGNTYEHTLHQIESAAYSWLGPVFFLNLGASIIIESEVLSNVIWYAFGLFFGLFFGQLFSAAFAARYVPGGFTWPESFMIGFGMLGRAELFFVVLNICYNEKGIIDKEIFFTFTVAAMLLNLSVPICIALFKPFYVRSKVKELEAEGATPQAWGCSVDQKRSTRNLEPLSPKTRATASGKYVEQRATRSRAARLHRVLQVNNASSGPDTPKRLSMARLMTRSFGSSGGRRPSQGDDYPAQPIIQPVVSLPKEIKLMDPPHIRRKSSKEEDKMCSSSSSLSSVGAGGGEEDLLKAEPTTPQTAAPTSATVTPAASPPCSSHAVDNPLQHPEEAEMEVEPV